jgi:hypothetical protein
MARRTTFHITDLVTLASSMNLDFQRRAAFALAFSIVPLITNLSISLRLPLAFCKRWKLQSVGSCKALEAAKRWKLQSVGSCKALEAETGAGSSSESPEVIAWRDLSDVLAKLQKLRILRVRLDHDGQESWTVINERAIVSFLTPLAILPGLDTTLDLPKLHPKLETPERHFTDNSPPSPFPTNRILRHRSFGEDNGRDELDVMHRAEFPFLWEYVGTSFGVDDITVAELEVHERSLWKRGYEVEQEIKTWRHGAMTMLSSYVGLMYIFFSSTPSLPGFDFSLVRGRFPFESRI